MENEFVPYEIALDLKKLGFDEWCLARFDGGGFRMLPAYDPLKNSEISEPWFCVTPLWQQAFHFFINNYGLISVIETNGYSYIFKIQEITQDYIETVKDFATYEEAREACLIKMIDLCKRSI